MQRRQGEEEALGATMKMLMMEEVRSVQRGDEGTYGDREPGYHWFQLHREGDYSEHQR